MDQPGQQLGQVKVVEEGTRPVENKPISDARNPELDTNNTFVSLAGPSDGQLTDYRDPPRNLPISGLEWSRTSSRPPQGDAETNDANYQKIPRPWAIKSGLIGPDQPDTRTLKRAHRTTDINYEPLLRWYVQTIAQEPYHNTGSVRNTSLVHSQDCSPRMDSKGHAPSENSAEWGSSGQLRE